MAGCALVRCRLEEDRRFAVHFPCEPVAVAAGDIQVSALQREVRTRLVVEQRGLPARGVMAIFAAGIFGVADELSAVNILMATAALGGRDLEVDVLHGQFQVGRLMAVDTGNGPVRTG